MLSPSLVVLLRGSQVARDAEAPTSGAEVGESDADDAYDGAEKGPSGDESEGSGAPDPTFDATVQRIGYIVDPIGAIRLPEHADLTHATANHSTNGVTRPRIAATVSIESAALTERRAILAAPGATHRDISALRRTTHAIHAALGVLGRTHSAIREMIGAQHLLLVAIDLEHAAIPTSQHAVRLVVAADLLAYGDLLLARHAIESHSGAKLDLNGANHCAIGVALWHRGPTETVLMIDPNLLLRARQALGWTQRKLGETIGPSHRTASRWEAGTSTMFPLHAQELIKHVYPVDRELAAELAAGIGQTLESLGIEARPVVAAAEPPPVPSTAPMRDLIEAVVCAVADEANVPPKAVRRSVLLTLRRAVEVGLDLKAAGAAGLFETGG